MQLFFDVFSVLVLISIIAIIIMREKDEKKEREERFRNWMIWTLEDECGEQLEAFSKKVNESIQKKLEEMFQAD